MSLHVGVCYEADSIERIRYKDKVIWQGRADSNSTLSVNLPTLFGGNKKEGGVAGLVEVLLGGPAQVLPSALIAKLGQGASGTPGFRGLASLFFSGGGSARAGGFLWGSNNPYLSAIDVTVRRSPKGFYPVKAWIPDAGGIPASIQSLWSQSHALTTTYNAIFSSLTFNLTPAKADIYEPMWDGYYPSTSSFRRVTLTNYSATVSSSPVIGGTDIPPNGFTDVDGQCFARASSVISGVPNGAFRKPFGTFQARNGNVAAYSFDTGRVYTAEAPTGVPPISSPVRASMVVADPVTLAVGPAEVYICRNTSVTVYDFDLNLLSTFAATLPNAQDGQGRAWVDNGFLYFWSSDVDALRKIDLSTGTLVWAMPFASIPGDPYYSQQFAVYGDLIVRAYSLRSDPQTSWFFEGFQFDPGVYDRANANPAHIVYECLTNTDWGLGLSPAMIDTASFEAAADTLYAEGLGLSMMWSTQTTIEAFVNDVLGHIDGTYGINPQTGKIYLTLVRGGYSTDSLFELTPDNSRITRFQRKSLSETVNEVTVTWTNPENEQEETVTVHDLGNYAAQGVLNSSSSNYYGVRNAELATRLALRDLTRSAAPLASFEVDVDRSGWSFKPGEIVRLTSPEYGISQLPVRITSVNYGRPGASKVQVSLIEDVFSTPATAYVDVSGSLTDESVVSAPGPLEHFAGGSMPYYFVSRELGASEASALPTTDSNVALLGASTTQVATIDVETPVTDALGNTTYEYQGQVQPSGWAKLAAPLTKEPQSTGVTISDFTGEVLPAAGVFVLIGSSVQSGEIALVENVGSGLTLKRGLLDTVPKDWATGVAVWFIPDLNFSDPDERLAGELASYRLLPRNSGGPVDPSWVAPVYATADDRQHRPYRPANVKLNGAAWPAAAGSPLLVTFSRRNRLTEEPVVRGWTEGDVTPESGQTVTATLRRVDTNAVLAETTGITGTSVSLDSTYSGQVSLTLTSVRDGLSSYQPFVHTFTMAVSRATESGEDRITEDGEIRILEG